MDVREILHDRYVMEHMIGRGSFGQVAVAYDVLTDTQVALKVTKRTETFDRQALKEIEVLSALAEEGGMRRGGPRGKEDKRQTTGHPNIVALLDSFIQSGPPDGNQDEGEQDNPGWVPTSMSRSGLSLPGYRYLVFELLSYSLYDVLRLTSFKGVSLGLTQEFSRQILSALAYLRSHGVVHCDLKPENVLLCSKDRSAVKLIDFGSSCWSGEKGLTYVQSRFYRAPEVLLGLPYGCPIDMWSLGCMMVELHSGRPLFPGCNEKDQLIKIVEALGEIPLWMVEQCPPKKVALHFESKGDSFTGATSANTVDLGAPGSKPLRTTIAAAVQQFQARQRNALGFDENDEALAEETRSVHVARRRDQGQQGQGSTPMEQAMQSLHGLGIRDRITAANVAVTNGGGEIAVATTMRGPMHASSSPPPLHNLTEAALFFDLVERMLRFSAKDRLIPEDALAHAFFGAWQQHHPSDV